MFIKQLRPIHGWRAFFGEVGVIVLGILVALAAQQLVEDWTWRSKARQAEDQLTEENRDNFRYAAEHVVVQPCLDAQLDRLQGLITTGGARLAAAPPIDSSTGKVAFRQPSRPYRVDVWHSAISDGVASHIDRERRDAFATVYTQVDDLARLTVRGDVAGDSLNLFLVPLSLDSGVRAHLAELIAGQKSSSNQMSLVGAQVMDNLWVLGQAPPPSVTDAFLETSGTVRYCRSKRLPLAQWRAALIAERAASIATGDRTLDKQKYTGLAS